jgi:long-chain acyl-CoA synthetase
MQTVSFWQFAQENPSHLAVVDPDGTEHSAAEVLRTANQIVHGLRALGMRRGDCLATALPNGVEMLTLFMAAAQAGWYVTPLNWHLTAAEMAYILGDCGAKAFFAAGRFAEAAQSAVSETRIGADMRFSVAREGEGEGGIEGFRPLSALVEGQPTGAPSERVAGTMMTYTSGTTGRPKGVRRPVFDVAPELVATQLAGFQGMFGSMPGGDEVHLVVAPLYHTAVLQFATSQMHLGHTIVLMDRWTPEDTLALIERYRVTNSHMVPTMFNRLLKLPAEVRERYDVSSVRNMVHGAAPCPIETKRQMLAWWGPTIYEYYAASEGGGTLATPKEWLQKPGTVGKPWPISEIRILDDEHQPVAAGTPGTVWIRMGDHTFEYHQDEAKTADSWRQGFFTVGDAGYLDEDGYLFLCDRKADMIIVGGVNIYPAEIEAAFHAHPQVADVAVFGIPDEDLGESVKAVVELVDGAEASPELAAELLAFVAKSVAKYKLPRSIDFMDELPRDPNGKLYKRRLRDPYWGSGGPGGAR